MKIQESVPTGAEKPSAMVTGGSSGIGKAFAIRLARAGYRVVLTGRDPLALQAAMAAMPAGPHQVIAADLTQSENLQQLVSYLQDHPVNLLINNAGAGLYSSMHAVSWQKLQSMLQLNCEVVARLAHAHLQHAQAGDAPINVSSIMAFLPQPTSAMYCASKAFVTALSEALWFENRSRQIYVMGLHPGMTRTQFRVRAGGTAATYPWFAQQPEEVVEIAMRHLNRRQRPTVVCGRVNALLSAFPRLFSRRAVVKYLGQSRSAEPE